MPVDREHKPLFELLMSMGNTMFVGLPIVDALFPGGRAVFYLSLSCLPFNVLLFTYGAWRLQSGKENAHLRTRDIFSIPTLAALLSLVLFLLHPPLPGALRGLIATVAGGTTPLSMLVIGASLGSVSLLDAFRNRQLYLASAVRLLLIPLVTWLVCGLMTRDPVLRTMPRRRDGHSDGQSIRPGRGLHRRGHPAEHGAVHDHHPLSCLAISLIAKQGFAIKLTRAYRTRRCAIRRVWSARGLAHSA